jgi:hypothetical protein
MAMVARYLPGELLLDLEGPKKVIEVAEGIEDTERLSVRHSLSTRMTVSLQYRAHLRHTRRQSTRGATSASVTTVSTARSIRRSGLLPGLLKCGLISPILHPGLAGLENQWLGEVTGPAEYTSAIASHV